MAAYAASLSTARTATDCGKAGAATVRTVFQDLGTFLDDEFRPALESCS